MFKRNYTNHIAVSIIICVAIPAAILFGIMQLDQNAFTKYHVSQVATKQLEVKMDDIDKWLSGKLFEVEQYEAAVNAYRKSYGFNDAIPDFLTKMMESSKDITYLYVSTEAGNQYVSGQMKPLLDGRIRPWYIGASKQEVYVSAPYKDVLTQKLVVTFSKAIRDEHGVLQGVIAMDVLLGNIVEKIESTSSGDKYSIAIKSEDGSYPYISSSLEELSVKKALENTFDLLDLKIGRKKYAGLRYDLTNMHTSVYVLLDLDNYKSDSRYFNKEYLFNAFIVIVSLVLLIRVFSNVLYKPLARLSSLIEGSDKLEIETNLPKLPDDLRRIMEKYLALHRGSYDRQFEVEQMNMHVHERNSEIENVNEELAKSFKRLSVIKDELEEQEEKYLDLVNNIKDVIWICDIRGYLIYGNKPFERLTGIDMETDERIYVGDFIEGLDVSGDKIKLFLDRDYNHIEVDIRGRQGQKHSMEGSVSRIFESDKLIAVQGIFRDVSDSRNVYFDYYNRNRELTLVNDITKALISNTELDLVLNNIAKKVGQVMSVSICTIRVYENDKFVLAASAGAKEQIIYDDPPGLESSHMGIAFKENRSLSLSSEVDFLMDDPALYEAMEELDFVLYIPLSTNDNVYGIMSIGTDAKVKKEKIKILETLADQAAIAIERMQIFAKLRNHYFKTIEALVAANDAKVPKMEGHTKRVSDIAVEVGKRMYLRKKDIDDIYIAGLLHDIGKMNIPDALLSKEKDLTEAEKEILDRHPVYAKKILEPIGMSHAITEGIYYHHKKFDLTGEPSDEDLASLPLIARIIGAVDDLDAFMVGRDGSKPLTLAQAMEKIELGAGSKYCPEVVRILKELQKNAPHLINGQYEVIQVDKEASI